MENRERYKRLIMFLASAFILTLQTGVFAYVWFKDYAFSGAIGEAFWKRGNYVVIAQYALMLYFFYRIYGGFKVGYLRVFEVLYSQVLSVLCVNAITYLQLALIGRWKFTKFIEPILKMTGVDLVIVLIILRAGFGRDGEALGHGQTDVGHLGQVRALAAQKLTHGSVAFREQVDILFAHWFSSIKNVSLCDHYQAILL